MGGVVSTGQDNDDLIDNLKEAEYIKTAKVEQVFRIVDRAHYYLPESRDNAYKDLAWKSGTLHLSAPCIYSEVMEALDLKPGLSFLNLGSGTGYLNTMVGFMIGPHGINHGIELHTENVDYAEERLKEFKEKGKKFDDLELCEPVFVQGNCLHLAPENRRYDRVYCGAACPPDLKSTLQNLIKLDGILVMPVGDQLLKVKRISETEFTSENVLPVSFASLYVPPTSKEPTDLILMPEVNPVSLQNQCATVVRNAIRHNFSFDIPSPKEAPSKQNKKLQASELFHQENVRLPLNFLPTAQRLMIMGAFGQSDDSNNSDADDDQTDESYLDLQLQRHAQERQRANERRRRDRNNGNTDEVDSSLSDEDMNELDDDQDDSNSKSTEIESGNNNRHLKSVVEDMESIDSEDGIVADDEGGEDDEFEDANLKDLSYGFGKRQKDSRNSHKSQLESANSSKSSSSATEHSSINRSDASDVCKSSDSSVKVRSHVTGSQNVLSKPNLSLSSDEDDQLVANAATLSSGPIRVVTSSYPRRYKSSYSTSAEASETSGFGSLGDDTFNIGSLQSNSVFCDSKDEDGDITDETSFDDAGVFTSEKMETSNVKNVSLLKSSGNAEQGASSLNSQGNKTIEEEAMDENDDDNNIDESTEDHHISTDEDFSSSEESDDDVKRKYTPSEPRGPDFTAFLKKQVETLPIPNTLKLFIIRYR